MSKRTQKKNQVKKRVTAKSKPMMSLIARAPINYVIFGVRKPWEEKL